MMKKIYMMLLALASVVMVQAEAPYLSEIEFSTKNGSPRISLKDSFNYGTEYITRRYVVYACDGETEILQMASFDESKSKGGSVSNYSVKDSTICKLYKGGVSNLRLYVAASYQTEKDGEFTPYLNENNDRTFYGEYTLPSVYSVSGYTMMSDAEKDTVYNYTVFEKQAGAYIRYYEDSARLGVLLCAISNMEYQWQKREVTDTKDVTTPWQNVGAKGSVTATEAQAGFLALQDMDLKGEGGFRNQYWRMIVTVGGQNDTTKVCDVFPEYPFVMVGPVATSGGSYYSPDVNVEAGEKDTIWANYGVTKSFTGSKAAPCNTVVSCSPACESKIQESGIYTVAQPGKCVTVTTSEKTNIRLTFLDSDKATVLKTIDCQCGKTLSEQSIAAPDEPQKQDSTFSAWVLSWKTAWNYTSTELVNEVWTVDTKLFARYTEATALEDILASMPKDTKVYTILGQPVGEGYKGIVVVGGKKFLVQ